jgi:hypothetical protein
VRADVEHLPFGVAGLTRLDAGRPLSRRLLIGELARLGADVTFLRRSFLADTATKDLSREVPILLDAVQIATHRNADEVRTEREELVAVLRAPGRALQ